MPEWWARFVPDTGRVAMGFSEVGQEQKLQKWGADGTECSGGFVCVPAFLYQRANAVNERLKAFARD